MSEKTDNPIAVSGNNNSSPAGQSTGLQAEKSPKKRLPAKRKPGRPPAFNKRLKKRFLQVAEGAGRGNLVESLKICKVTDTAYYYARKNDPTFAWMADDALDKGQDNYERHLVDATQICNDKLLEIIKGKTFDPEQMTLGLLLKATEVYDKQQLRRQKLKSAEEKKGDTYNIDARQLNQTQNTSIIAGMDLSNLDSSEIKMLRDLATKAKGTKQNEPMVIEGEHVQVIPTQEDMNEPA